MPIGPYTADPDNANQPIDQVSGGHAAAELRALKAKINTEIQIDTPVVTTGVSNAYVVSTWPDAPTSGVIYRCIANHTNTGAATLTPGAGTSVQIIQLDNASAIIPGMIVANCELRLLKTSVGFILLNPQIPTGNGTNQGQVKLSDSVSSTYGVSSGYAATPSAIKAVMDVASANTSALTTHKSSGDHDSRYYTETEIDAIIAAYSFAIADKLANTTDISQNETVTVTGDSTIDTTLAGNTITVAVADGGITAAELATDSVGQAALKAVEFEVSITISDSSSILYLSGALPAPQYILGGPLMKLDYTPNQSPWIDPKNNATIRVTLIGDMPADSVYGTNVYYGIPGHNTYSITTVFYLKSRYIQASPPYDLGDGEIPLFIFAEVKPDGTVNRVYVAEDAPWHYSGPNDVIPTRYGASGKAYKRVPIINGTPSFKRNPFNLNKVRSIAELRAGRSAIANKQAIQYEEVELTQTIKDSNMNFIPHPFFDTLTDGCSVVLLDPVAQQLDDLKDMLKAGESVADLLHDDYLVLDSTPIARNCPAGVTPIALKWKNTK